MNGSTSPRTSQSPKNAGDAAKHDPAAVNGHRSPSARPKSSPSRSQTDGGQKSPEAKGSAKRSERAVATGGNNDEDSEAETLIDSPVKKKEAEKQKTAVKLERPPKHRIGSLPVPTDGDDENDVKRGVARPWGSGDL